MEYLVADFTIQSPEGLLQTARDLLADSISEAGFESFEDTDKGLRAYVQEELFDRSAMQTSIEDFIMPDVKITYTVSKAENKDWNEAWENEGFDPIDIDGKLRIVDANNPNRQTKSEKGETIIKIAARQAFGTGTHQTTRMICSMLLGIDLKNKKFLDCGCGTGILGIVASKLDASEVVGFDIDEWSVENAAHNAALNEVSNMQVFQGDCKVLSHVSGVFDVVVANINRNILLADMPEYKEVMSSDGILILSGFYTSDVPMLTEKASQFGLHETGRKQEDDWCCLKLEVNGNRRNGQ